MRNANQVWLDRGFTPLPEFLDVMTGDYGAPLAVVDFAGNAEAARSTWEAVELPYRGDEVSMFVVVPADLQAFEASLTPARLDEIIGAIRDGGIHLSMPRFSFRFHASRGDLRAHRRAAPARIKPCPCAARRPSDTRVVRIEPPLRERCRRA